MGEALPRPERKPMGPREILNYAAKQGRSLERYAVQSLAMIEEAEERGIPINLADNEALKKFAVHGEYEEILIRLIADMLSVNSALLLQGVKMTKEDLAARLKKMGQTKT
jgi:hypothetical protein